MLSTIEHAFSTLKNIILYLYFIGIYDYIYTYLYILGIDRNNSLVLPVTFNHRYSKFIPHYPRGASHCFTKLRIKTTQTS